MIILKSLHFFRVAIDPICRRSSERLGTLNAACEKFRFSEVQRCGHVLERARGVYECRSIHRANATAVHWKFFTH